MTEQGNAKLLVHVKPIWRRKKRIKSFKQAALIVLELIRLGACAKQTRLSLEIMAQEMGKLLDKDQAKEERLRKVQSLAKVKKREYENIALEDWKQKYLKAYRERFRHFVLLEKMNGCNESRRMDSQIQSKVSCFGTSKHSDFENRRIGIPATVTCLKNTEGRNPTSPTTKTRKLKGACLTKPSQNAGKEGTKLHQANGGQKAQNEISKVPIKRTEDKLQVLGTQDSTHDSRFQKLIRILTPIDTKEILDICQRGREKSSQLRP